MTKFHPAKRVRITLDGQTRTGTLLCRTKYSSPFDWYVEIDVENGPCPFYEHEMEVIEDE